MAMRIFIGILVLSVFSSITSGQYNKSGIIAKGASLQKLSGGFSFTEGPACDAKGNIYFTDQPNNRILIWTTESKLDTFMNQSGRSNGLYFDLNGNLIACADEHNELWSISPDKNITVLLKGYEGKAFNGPNDVWVSPSGKIYITDPYYQRPWWDHKTPPQEGRNVYLYDPDAGKLLKVTSGLKQPNGIIGTPDGQYLYVADIDVEKTYRYKIKKNGTLSDKTLFAEMGSDGMTIDSEGNIYLTGDGVTVFDPQGKQIEHIPVDEKWTANVCFGGKDRHLLFITASESVYGLKMKVHGVK